MFIMAAPTTTNSEPYLRTSLGGLMDDPDLEVIPASQVEMHLISRKAEDRIVHQRATDGYINATAMCKAVRKKFHDYFRLRATGPFLQALADKTGIPTSSTVEGIPSTGLIQTIQGGPAHLQGTWVHPRVAIHLAQWLSPEFAVQVTEWVFDWLDGQVVYEGVRLPDHVRRYLVNRPKIPMTHFSMLDQMTLKLLAPLEDHGYILPAELWPDISLGRIFSGWLRRQGHDPDSFPTYEHEFTDGRNPVPARLYPNELMTSFNQQLDIWLRTRARRYFGDRDPDAILPLDSVLAALPPPPKKLNP